MTDSLIAASAARQAAILQARAAALAQEPDQDAGAQPTFDMLELRLGEAVYGIESRYVHEVYPLKKVTPLPGVPAFVRGIISLRGYIVSIIDLRTLLGLAAATPGTAPPAAPRAIIVQAGTMEVGLWADAILGLRAVSPLAMQPAPAAPAGGSAGYLRGVTPDRVLLLDIGNLLADDKIVVADDH